MKQYIPLIVLFALCLVPYGLVARQSPALDYLFNVVFHSPLAHIAGHGMIFAAIGAASLRAVPALRHSPAAYAALILLAALGQEGLQMLDRDELRLADSLGDMLVDLVAAAIVWGVVSPGPRPGRREGGV